MYQVIFFEKSFSGQTEYVTEPIWMNRKQTWIGSLQVMEVNPGTSIEIVVETSETGDIEASADWTKTSSPTVLREVGTTKFTIGNLLSWARFRINIRNRVSRPDCKITLSGETHETGV